MGYFFSQFKVFLVQIKCRLIVLIREPSALVSLMIFPVIVIPSFYVINNPHQFFTDPELGLDDRYYDNTNEFIDSFQQNKALNPLVMVAVTNRLKNHIETSFGVDMVKLLTNDESQAFIITEKDSIENKKTSQTAINKLDLEDKDNLDTFQFYYHLIFDDQHNLHNLLKTSDSGLFFYADLDPNDSQRIQYKIRSSWVVKDLLQFPKNLLLSDEFEPSLIAFNFNSDFQKALQFKNENIEYIGARYSDVNISNSLMIDIALIAVMLISFLLNILNGLGITLVSDRSDNILKRYLTTPMSRWTYIASHYVAQIIIALIQIALILVPGYFLLGTKIHGSVVLSLLIVIIGTIMFSSLTALLASRTTNKGFYSGMASLICIVMFSLSGGFLSRQVEGPGVTVLSYLPANAMMESIESVMFYGQGLWEIYYQLIIMVTYSVVFSIIAHCLFVWYEE